MGRSIAPVVQAFILAVSIGSCTCRQEVAPPPMPTRPPGFQAALPTPTRAVKPAAPTATALPAAAESPTAAVDIPVPTDFPSDVPLFKGATVAAVQQLGGGAHNVLFSTDAKPEEIYSFYRDDLKGKGFQVTQQYQSAEQSFLSFKKDQLVTNVIITGDPRDKSRRVIAIMYQIEEEVEEF